jgi:hypothetical protein
MIDQSHTIYNSAGDRRVLIFPTENGAFGFVEDKFLPDPSEQCWVPVTHDRSQSICATREIAMREAIGRIGWLAATIDDLPAFDRREI